MGNSIKINLKEHNIRLRGLEFVAEGRGNLGAVVNTVMKCPVRK